MASAQRNKDANTTLALLVVILTVLFVIFYFSELGVIGFFGVWETAGQSDFDQGSYYNTFYNTTFVQLLPQQPAGTYTSRVFDADAVAQWSSIAWAEGAPYGEELPANNAVEDITGGANMSENVLLLHLNEDAGATIFTDSSSGNNYGFCYGDVESCPVAALDGIFSTAVFFDGSDDKLVISNIEGELNISTMLTIETWINPSDPEWNNKQQSILSRLVHTESGFSDTQRWDVYDATNEDSQNGMQGFFGAAFDGRYIYFPPYSFGSQLYTKILRYDTKGQFLDTNYWDYYDAQYEGGQSDFTAYRSAVFDGRYVYFVPYYSQTTNDNSGKILRYDTTRSFFDTNSWDIYNAENEDGQNGMKGFNGGVFDGRHVYFVQSNKILRYDIEADFFNTNSWDVFDPASLGVSTSYIGAILAGGYVYFVPYTETGASLNALRYNTSRSFSDNTAWQIYNVKNEDGANGISGLIGAAFDGRHIYFSPFDTGKVLRYDVTGNFADMSSWDVYDAINEDGANSMRGFIGDVFDGRYIYFVPNSNGGYFGKILRYDATQDFFNTNSWDVYNAFAEDGVGEMTGFNGAVFDGRYVHFVPFQGRGKVLRYDTSSNLSYGLDYSLSSNSFGDAQKTPSFRIATSSGIRTLSARNLSGFNSSWHHIAGTYNGTAIKLYIDGELSNSVEYDTFGNIQKPTVDRVDAYTLIRMGASYYGKTYLKAFVDEIAVYNRTLSEQEILDHYKRGALRLNLTVRSCDDVACAGEAWAEEHEQASNLTVSNNRYFQYRANFFGENLDYSPLLYNVTVMFNQMAEGVSVYAFDQEMDAEQHELSNDPAVYANETTNFYANFTAAGEPLGRLLWNANVDGEAKAVAVLDADNDGVVDQITVSTGDYSTDGDVYSFSVNGTLLWRNQNPESYSYDVETGDFNNDGKNEIATAEHEGKVRIFNSTGAQLWESATTGAGMFSMSSGDLDNDNIPEIVVGDRLGKIFAFKPFQGLWWTYSLPDGSSTVNEVTVAETQDGKIVLGSFGDGYIIALNSTGSLVWSWPEIGILNNWGFTSLAVTDINNDGFVDRVAGGGRYGRLFMFDASGNALWNRSTGCSSSCNRDVVMTDIDHDSTRSETVASGNGDVYAYSSTGTLLWDFSLPSTYVYSLAAGDIDGDGFDEIIAAGADTTVYAIGSTGNLIWSFKTGSIGDIYGSSGPLAIADINNDYVMDIVVGDDSGFVYALQDSSCDITFSDNLDAEMIWNQEINLWQFNRSFTPGNLLYQWNATCTKAGLSASATGETLVQQNAQPIITNMTITPENATESDSIICKWISIDHDADILTATVKWTNDTETVRTENNIQCYHGAECSSMPLSNLIAGANYTCLINLTDGITYSTAEITKRILGGGINIQNIALEATFNAISVYVNYSGDENKNAVVYPEFRSDGSWQRGINLVQSPLSQNTLTGSIFFLDENTDYDVRVVAMDPDGSEGFSNATVKTRNWTWPANTGRNFYVAVNGSDDGDGSADAPFRSIQKAVNVSDQPGDTIYVREGTYYEQITMMYSGAFESPISLIGFNAIIDGSDPSLLNTTWTDESDGIYSLVLQRAPMLVYMDEYRLFNYPSYQDFTNPSGMCWTNDYWNRSCITDGWVYYSGSLYMKLPDRSNPQNHIMHINMYVNDVTEEAISAVSRQWLSFSNITIQYAHIGISPVNTHYTKVSGNVIKFGKRGVNMRSGSSYNLVEWNTLYDTNLYNWPWNGHKSDGIYGGDQETQGIGADENARGNVIRYNLITGFANGIGSNGHDTDIYGNIITQAADDALEPEFISPTVNLRYYNNFATELFSGISLAPVNGVIYFFDNIITNTKSKTYKIASGEPSTGSIFLWHTTGWSDYSNPYYPVKNFDAGNPFYGFELRNNIFSSPNYTVLHDDSTEPQNNTMDYDVLYTISNTTFFKWKNKNYPDIDDVQNNLSFEMHGREADPMFVLPVLGIISNNSPAVDAGVFIPGFHCALPDNIDPGQKHCRHWHGTSPDAGAYEVPNASIDTQTPLLSLREPQNTTYTSTNRTLNFTVSDNVMVDRCWYSLNNQPDTPISQCMNTTFIAAQGHNTITVSTNDTSNNRISIIINFTVVIQGFTLAIQQPQNATYASTNITLNFTVSADACWYSLNNMPNTSISGCRNTTFIAQQGLNVLHVYANDTSNNIASAQVNFTVNTTTPDSPPAVMLQQPANTTLVNVSAVNFVCNATDDINVTQVSLYTNTSGTWASKTTMPGNKLNYTINSVPDGRYAWNCLAADTANQESFAAANYTFRVNKTYYTLILNLTPGLNFVSVPFLQNNYSINYTLQPVIQNITKAYHFSRVWKIFRPAYPAQSNFVEIGPRKGFFVYATSPSYLRINGYATYGDESTPPLALENGWNMYGVHGPRDLNFTEAFGSYAPNVLSVWKYDNGYVKLNATNLLKPGSGYFVYYQP